MITTTKLAILSLAAAAVAVPTPAKRNYVDDQLASAEAYAEAGLAEGEKYVSEYAKRGYLEE